MSFPAGLPLIDGFNRLHNNLRLSVTDRCNIRCVYCMPESVQFLPRRDVLTFEEIERVARIAAGLGVNKIRLTGGEPLVRKDLPVLVERLVRLDGIRDVGLTTNGMLLPSLATDLHAAGLRRINVSLDTLDPARFEQITRRPGLDQVLKGIQAALDAGFNPVKLNAVAIKGLNDADVVPLARYARDHGVELRYIEYMPLDAEDRWERGKVLLAREILDELATVFGPLVPDPAQDPRAPAQDYLYTDGHPGRVGIIASISRPFCLSCNRIRVTAEGKLRNCLFAHEETDLRALLRSDADDATIAQAFHASVAAKAEGHEINTARFLKPARTMHTIGG